MLQTMCKSFGIHLIHELAMSYSLNKRGCVPVHAHYSNLPNFVCLHGRPRFQMALNF